MWGGTWEQAPDVARPHLMGVCPPPVGLTAKGWGVEAKRQLPIQRQAEEHVRATQSSIIRGE